MPLVKVGIQSGTSAEARQAVSEGIRLALNEALQVRETQCLQAFYELEPGSCELPAGPSALMVIEITLFKGRSVERKRNLYQAMVRRLAERLPVEAKDIVIILHEVPLENWGIKGGIPAAEDNLEYEIEVQDYPL